eukprot:jgi/Tetstr1/424816/TSEL_015319.t1
MTAELRRLRRLDIEHCQLDPLLVAELDNRFGLHYIDRFASALNTLLPRCNVAWLDPSCEAVDSLHVLDAGWRRENNLCNAPWPVLPNNLVLKLVHSGAAAAVVGPRWDGKAWHHVLAKIAVEDHWSALEPRWSRAPACPVKGGKWGGICLSDLTGP